MPHLKSFTYSPLQVDYLPNRCPRCHISISAVETGWLHFVTKHGQSRICQVVLTCPSCFEAFFANYDVGYAKSSFANVEPRYAEKETFGELETVSPLFAIIFNQAVAAEAADLNEIAGLGYRKALEFLIKDFAIYRNPNEAQEIKALPLGKVVTQFVTDKKIKMSAQKATWLGNDEAHYVRIWTTHDISHLKKLLRIAISDITGELEFDKLQASFNSPPTPKP